MERMEIKDDTSNVNEICLFREPIVLISIIFLSFLRGISACMDEVRFFGHIQIGEQTASIQYSYIMLILAPLPGLILITLISQIHGRKPAFIILFVLTLLYGIISYLPYGRPWNIGNMIGNFIAASLKGGVLSITALAICEYSSPKHRFAYLVANEVVQVVGVRVTTLLYSGGIISKESSYLSVFVGIVALACLISVHWWPESPYWLAGQYRYEDSKVSFMRLHREGDEARGELQTLETTRRRPTPKLFWLSLLIAILTVSVAKCATSGRQFLAKINGDILGVTPLSSHFIISLCVGLVLTVVIILVSYKIKRKIVYLGVTIITLLPLYVISIWVYAVGEKVHNPTVLYFIMMLANICIECGVNSLSLALSIEFLPQKYNTIISCLSSSYFFVSVYFFSMLPLNYHGSFSAQGFVLLFATIALVTVIILYCLVPETQDKNLMEIEKYYLNKYCDNTEQNQAEDVCHTFLTCMFF